jgi:hypothetical protein
VKFYRTEGQSDGCNPSRHDGSDFLSPRERQTLAEIEDAVSATDPHLGQQLTDNDIPDSIMVPPTWVAWLARGAFIMLPVTLLVPYKWWAALAVLAALVAALKLPRSPNVH